jgi:hypothetical protein
MSGLYSYYDQLADKLNGAMLEAQDFKNQYSGSESSLLRIRSNPVAGDWTGGQEEWELETQLVSNIHIRFPLAEVEYFNNVADDQYSDNASIDLWQILPIEATLGRQADGEFDDEITAVEKDDILVKVVFDQGRKIPIKMKVTKAKAHFFGRQVVRKSLEMTLLRETVEDDIQAVIDEYVDTLGVPSVISTIPVDEEVGYIGSGVVIGFNLEMDTTGFESGLVTFDPSLVDSDYSWNLSGTILTVTDLSGLIGGTDYTVVVDEDIRSKYGVGMEEDFPFEFQTA